MIHVELHSDDPILNAFVEAKTLLMEVDLLDVESLGWRSRLARKLSRLSKLEEQLRPHLPKQEVLSYARDFMPDNALQEFLTCPVTQARLDALEEVREAEWQYDQNRKGKQVTDDPPKELITTCVAVRRFCVSRATLDRAVKSGKLKSHRVAGSAPNSQHLFSEAELDARYQRRPV